MTKLGVVSHKHYNLKKKIQVVLGSAFEEELQCSLLATAKLVSRNRLLVVLSQESSVVGAS